MRIPNSHLPERQHMIRKFVIIALPLVIVIGIGVWLLLRHEVHRETKESPCGKYRADFYTFLYSNLLPGPPGAEATGRVASTSGAIQTVKRYCAPTFR